MSVAPLLTQGIGPKGTVPLALTGGLYTSGTSPVVTALHAIARIVSVGRLMGR